MNENINLCEILKGLEGIELYSSIFGKVILREVEREIIFIKTTTNAVHELNSKGQYYGEFYPDSECVLFPSKDQRDWSKFERPIPINTPMMCCEKATDWRLRYYSGFVSIHHTAFSYGKKSTDINAGKTSWSYMIPFDKFDPNNIAESLRYNIQKSEEIR